jgi:hypothetical protein
MIDISKYVISKEEFDKGIEESFLTGDDYVVTITPDDNTRKIEQLLGITDGELGPSRISRGVTGITRFLI